MSYIMKQDNNNDRTSQRGTPKGPPTLLNSARFVGSGESIPYPGENLTSESLRTILQRTLELVAEEMEDWEDDFYPASRSTRPSGGGNGRGLGQ